MTNKEWGIIRDLLNSFIRLLEKIVALVGVLIMLAWSIGIVEITWK